MARRRAPTSIRQARARKVTRARVVKNRRIISRPISKGRPTRRISANVPKRVRTQKFSRRIKRRTITRKPKTSLTGATIRGKRVGLAGRKKSSRAGRGGTGSRRIQTFSVRRRAGQEAKKQVIGFSTGQDFVRGVKNLSSFGRSSGKLASQGFGNPVLGQAFSAVRGAGKQTRRIVDAEIEDFNVRTSRKGTKAEFPSTSRFIDFFGVTEFG